MYTWHVTFADQPAVHRAAAVYRAALTGLALDPVADEWLHLTMQGVGFVDEVPRGVAAAVADAARVRLSGVAPFTLVFDRVVVDAEGVGFRFGESGPGLVRAALRAAIGDVMPVVPEAADGFAAHVTVAYSNADGSLRPVLDAVALVDVPPVEVRVSRADLIVLGRDTHAYTWEVFASVSLGG